MKKLFLLICIGCLGLLGSASAQEAPIRFSVKLPEGNYQVTVYLGDPMGTSRTTVKAETMIIAHTLGATNPSTRLNAVLFW